MAAQKRKAPGVPGAPRKKDRKLKKAPAAGTPPAPASPPGSTDAHPESRLVAPGARGVRCAGAVTLLPASPPAGVLGRCPVAATWLRPRASACALASPSAGWIWFQPRSAGLTCAVREARRGARAGQTRRPGTRRASPDTELSAEERRVLERKQKKERKKEERKRLREAGAVAPAQPLPAKPSGAQLALDYLCGWAQKRQSWRFQKTRQTWLLLHMYDCDQVPDQHFPTLLAYLEGLQGRARELTVQKAEALMRQLDEAGASPDRPLLERSRRARQVLQLLS